MKIWSIIPHVVRTRSAVLLVCLSVFPGCSESGVNLCDGPEFDRYTVDQLSNISARCDSLPSLHPGILPLEVREVVLNDVVSIDRDISVGSDNHITRYTLPSLVSLQSIECRDSDALRAIDLPALQSADRITASGCAEWNQIEFPELVETDSINIDFSGTQALSVVAPQLETLGSVTIVAASAEAVALDLSGLQRTQSFAAIDVTARSADTISVDLGALPTLDTRLTIDAATATSIAIDMGSVEVLNGRVRINAPLASSVTLETSSLRVLDSILPFEIDAPRSDEFSLDLPSLTSPYEELRLKLNIGGSVSVKMPSLDTDTGIGLHLELPSASSISVLLDGESPTIGLVNIDAPSATELNLEMPSTTECSDMSPSPVYSGIRVYASNAASVDVALPLLERCSLDITVDVDGSESFELSMPKLRHFGTSTTRRKLAVVLGDETEATVVLPSLVTSFGSLRFKTDEGEIDVQLPQLTTMDSAPNSSSSIFAELFSVDSGLDAGTARVSAPRLRYIDGDLNLSGSVLSVSLGALEWLDTFGIRSWESFETLDLASLSECEDVAVFGFDTESRQLRDELEAKCGLAE